MLSFRLSLLIWSVEVSVICFIFFSFELIQKQANDQSFNLFFFFVVSEAFNFCYGYEVAH